MTSSEPVHLRDHREPLSVLFSARTDAGIVRASNEDNFLVDRRLRLYVVCDGLGGHQSGEIASATAVGAVREGVLERRDVIEAFERGETEEPALLEMLASVAHMANFRIYERGRHSIMQRGMGTTMSLMLFAGARAFIVHVGDTRIYRLRAGTFTQLTEDHSLMSEMRRGMYLSREQIDALDGRLKNQITRAVGVHETVEVDVTSCDVAAGDRYLLCSDGLHGAVPDAELSALLAQPEISDAASRFIDRANAAGGKDNITAIALELVLPPAPSSVDASQRKAWPVFEVARTASLFNGLTDLELASLVEHVAVTHVASGDALVRDASSLGGAYIVLEGELQVLKQAEVVAMLRRGDFFAEDALLAERSSGTTVLAATSGASVALLERRRFEELQRTSPNVAMKLAIAVGRVLARKVDAAAREGTSMRHIIKDPGAHSRPVPRPATSPRVLADTEPEPMLRREHEGVAAASATVLRRPRGDRRAGNAVTHPAIPVVRGPSSSELALGPNTRSGLARADTRPLRTHEQTSSTSPSTRPADHVITGAKASATTGVDLRPGSDKR